MKEFFKKSIRITGKVFKWILIVFIVLFVLIFAVWKIPAIHEYAINKGTSFFNEKTGGNLSIGEVDLRLPFFIGLENISLESPDGNKLASINDLEIYPGWRMLFAKTIRIDEINLSGVDGKIFVNKKGDFNFDFIVDGFSDTTAAPASPQDTTGGGWGFSLGDLNLAELSFIYADRTTGDSIDIQLGNFELDMDELDLENQAYLAESILLENSAVYAQISASEESTDTTSTTLPKLGLEELEISNALVELKMGKDPAYKFDLGELFLETEEIDLNENTYLVNDFSLANSRFLIPLPPADTTSTSGKNQPEQSEDAGSFFPDLKAVIEKIELENIELRAFTDLDTLHSLSNLALAAEEINVGLEGYSVKLENLTGSYNEFTDLKEFHGDFAFKTSTAKAQEVTLLYGQSSVNLNATLDYDNVEKLISQFKMNFLDIELSDTRIAAKDIEKAYDILELDSLPVPARDIFITLNAKGNQTAIDLSNLRVKTGNSFAQLRGNISSKGDSLWPGDLILKKMEISLMEKDLIPYTAYLGVEASQIPPSLNLQLSGRYNSQKAEAEGSLKTPYGDVAIDLKGDGWSAKRQGMVVTVDSELLRIGEYLKMAEELTADFSFSVETENIADSVLHLCTELFVDTLNYAGYRYTDLDLDAEMLGNEIQYAFAIRDTFANAAFGGTLDFDSGIDALVSGTINGIDLQGLGYAEKDIRGSLDIKARYHQDSLITTANALIDEILFVKEGERFSFDPMEATFYNGPDSASADLTGGFIELHSVSNRSVDSLITDISNMIARGKQEKISDQNAYWKANLEISDLDDISELFFPDLREFEPSYAEVDFSTEDNQLLAKALFPGIKYGDFSLDSLSLTTTDSDTITQRKLFINRLAYDTLALYDLKLALDRTKSGAKTLLTINPDTSDNHYRIGADLTADSVALSSGFSYQFSDTLVLNGEEWNYEDDCSISSDDLGISFQDFKIYNGEKVIRLEKEEGNSPLNIIAENFPLKTFTGMFNTEEELFNGTLNGHVLLHSDGSFEGDGDLSGFEISGANFGKLTWSASKENEVFKTEIRDEGENIDLLIDGTISPQSDTTSALDLQVNLKRLEMILLEEVLANSIAEASGILTSKMTITGTTTSPEINGEVGFENAKIRPAGSRSGYLIQNEKIQIEPGALTFNTFTLKDENGSELSIEGTIKHQNFNNPKLDLKIESEDFILADFEESSESSIYGKLVADLNLTVMGPMTAPVVDARVKVNKPTDFTYVVTSEADVEAFDESLLVWSNFDEVPNNDILTRSKEEEQNQGNIFAGNPKIKGNLVIDKSAVFKVIVDADAGDYLQIQGAGKLDIDYDRTGALRFNGVYEVDQGYYQMTFYDIQKKRFDFISGSKLVWNGEPTNANVDITAAYNTKAGIANLMLTDPSASYDNAFQQQLPFLVLLNVDGKLLEPEISFDIQLAEEAKGALSGSVAARLNDLRSNESRLNKQVFALLILNSFLPQEGGAESNVLANQARNSASQILTNQLNTLSDKYVKGVDINFDMNSYGGTAGQGNTDLSVNLEKSFADDRIIVKVGSTVAIEDGNSGSAQSSQQQFMTNVEVEYKLTPDGRYRLLVFSKTDLEDIVIGRITRSGGGVVFQRDFDRFRYLFEPREDESEEENDEEKEENEE